MRSHGGHFSLTPGPLTLPLTWPAWHFNPRPTARMAAALPTTAYITLSSHVLRSVLMAGLHGASCFCLIAYARVPSSSRDGLSFPCRRVASTLALMRHSPYAWLACPPSQDAAWSFYLYAYPSSVFTWRVSGEDVHVLPCPLLSYAGFVCPAGLRGLWKVINNVYIITCTRNIFASFLRFFWFMSWPCDLRFILHSCMISLFLLPPFDMVIPFSVCVWPALQLLLSSSCQCRSA